MCQILGMQDQPDWRESANCRGINPDLFFPERGELVHEAKAVCAGCVVREECLEDAQLHKERFGVWGGMTERERRKLRTQRRHSA